jgi:hypothetical protein
LTPAASNSDCVACAIPALQSAGFIHSGRSWRDRIGRELAVSIAFGPSAIDFSVTSRLVTLYRSLDVVVSAQRLASEAAVSRAVKQGVASLGVFVHPLPLDPVRSLRTWTGVDDGQSFDLGWRSPAVDQAYASALQQVNPVDAQPFFANADSDILQAFWSRPLFNLPSLVIWQQHRWRLWFAQSSILSEYEVPTWS